MNNVSLYFILLLLTFRDDIKGLVNNTLPFNGSSKAWDAHRKGSGSGEQNDTDPSCTEVYLMILLPNGNTDRGGKMIRIQPCTVGTVRMRIRIRIPEVK